MLSFDDELRRHGEVLRRASAVRPGEHVLDIGCGSGLTTRRAASAARPGTALGVDISAAAIERARDLAGDGVRFECGDAQVHRFERHRFDVAISRFGTMFFGDPVAAFGNIGAALRPGGRLVMLVWRAADLNEWDVLIRRALGAPGGSDAFALADPAVVDRILRAAGFEDVTFTDVREPVYYGPDVDVALAWVRRFVSTREALDRLDPVARDEAIERLREMVAAHLGDDGVRFGSRAWLVTAARP